MFKNGFKNPLGALAILGTFYFPAVLYAWAHLFPNGLSRKSCVQNVVTYDTMVVVWFCAAASMAALSIESPSVCVGVIVLCAGRALALVAELWFVSDYFGALLAAEEQKGS